MGKQITQKSNVAGEFKIIPFGTVDPSVLSVIAAHLQTHLGLNPDIDPARDNPQYAFMAGRRQFDATKVIGALSKPDGSAFQLGVLGSDLCTAILTYVYGESQLGGKTAVISLYRLSHKNRQIYYARAAKIGLHEVGHLFGIGHCWQNYCLMRFCSSLDKLDALPMTFCSACEYEIARRLKTLISGGQ